MNNIGLNILLPKSSGNIYKEINGNQLYKIKRKKIEQLMYARQNRDTTRIKNILYEIDRIDEALKG